MPSFERWSAMYLDPSRRDTDGESQEAAAPVAAQPVYRRPRRHGGWYKVQEGREEFDAFARKYGGTQPWDRGYDQREQRQSPQGRVRPVIDLSRALMTVGLVLTLVAVSLLVGRAVGGHYPSLAELAWVAIALLLASRETR